ncbi:MAG TPA: hypothetical protein EYH45_01970 [Candidatus Caldiarchaeum subterraneum]|uniref:Sirohydrochlorin cobaltochelatase n=1 Tax=Caldiarchaeum subterraneum TaxID=311458 RepID=A0A833E9C4_CALS0|nr:hypothetical protein [Candidatus Caldarchaeum subterraneum]
MRRIAILVGHGQLPKDLPRELRSEYFRLRVKHAKTPEEEKRYQELDRTVANWPRNAENDPYWHNINKLAGLVREVSGFNEVIAAFNEFCSPTLEEALEYACRQGYEKIMVIPTMFIPGGVHSEEEIPEAIEEMKRKYRRDIIYVWPFNLQEIAGLITRRLNSSLEGGGEGD